jgi:hypothetical protein
MEDREVSSDLRHDSYKRYGLFLQIMQGVGILYT